MKLNEVFDRAVPYKVKQQTKDVYSGTFEVNGIKYYFQFDNDSEKQSTWDFVFRIDDMTPSIKKELKYGNFNSRLSLLKNSKNALPVYATVIDIIKDFTKKYNPYVIEIVPMDDRMNPVYKKIITRVLRTNNDYKLGYSHFGVFELINKYYDSK